MNNLSYYGVARINISGQEPIVLNNKGTRKLGLVITKALAGYNITNDIPKFFSIQIDEGNNQWTDLLNRKLPFTGITYDPSTTPNSDINCIGKLNLNTIILSTDKLTPSVSDNASLRLCMYSSDLSNEGILAEVQNDNLWKVFNDIVEGTDCIINWDMSFFNENNEGAAT